MLTTYSKEDSMEMLIFLFVLYLAFSVAAWYWGADSTESLASCEWERRQNWHGIERGQGK